MTDSTDTTPPLDNIDWAAFRFPTRPGVRSTQELLARTAMGLGSDSQAPTWAAPPTRIDSWHLDRERWLLSHPGQRKKVELLRITSRRRLAMVVDLISKQPSDTDQAALWRGLNQAIELVFGHGLGEMLAMGPMSWEWPVNLGQGGSGGQGGFAGVAHDEAEREVDPDGHARRRLGLNGV
jgi:hypothetical protein